MVTKICIWEILFLESTFLHRQSPSEFNYFLFLFTLFALFLFNALNGLLLVFAFQYSLLFFEFLPNIISFSLLSFVSLQYPLAAS